jgi:hypothetical protein
MKLFDLRLRIRRIYEIRIKKIERGYLLRNHFIYKNYLRLTYGLKFFPRKPPSLFQINSVLKTRKDVELAIKILKNSNLNINRRDIEKNWDSLIALNTILKKTNSSANFLDAGGLLNSLIIIWLYQFGYKNLFCINLIFKNIEKRGRVKYISGDLTKTPFPDNFFDVISCLSVIEHGIDEESYFNEMYRILKDGGLLITSTDYWEYKIDTNNNFVYNNPVFIYDKKSIKTLLDKAYKRGFTLYGPNIDYKCEEKVVNWKRFNLNYTFLIICLQKS